MRTSILAPLASRACGPYPMGRLLTAGCPRCGSPAPALQVRGELFRCTRCGLSGGPVQYLMAGGTTALEAARKLGILIAPPARIAQVLAAAQMAFERELWSRTDSGAARLLRDRGINPATASRFHLGLTPPPGNLTRYLLRRGFTLEEVVLSGLVRRRGRGYAEHLRGRLVFPLQDALGRPVGFAGRSIRGDRPKYLNTPASPAGGRGGVLFGLAQAIGHLRRRGEAWIVEGYFDALACHQAGLRWAVASCGVGLSMKQALLLRRYVRRAVLLYDGDASGEVIRQAFSVIRATGLQVACGRLPPEVDPDELILRGGAEELSRIAEEAGEVLP